MGNLADSVSIRVSLMLAIVTSISKTSIAKTNITKMFSISKMSNTSISSIRRGRVCVTSDYSNIVWMASG